jgi:hypothetical protein
MTRRPKQPLPTKNLAPSATDANAIVPVKVRLLGIGPMVWRRVLVPLACTLHVANRRGASVIAITLRIDRKRVTRCARRVPHVREIQRLLH